MLPVSNKTVVMTNCPRNEYGDPAERIAVSLRTQGIPAKAAKSAPDLGATTTACKQRDTTSQKQRMGKAGKRAPRVGIISRTDARAEKGYNTGVDPQMLYCTPLFGASFALVARMRTIAMKALRRVGHRPCPFTTIVWKLGPSKDPGVATAVRQVKLWIQVYTKALGNA